MPSYYLGVDVSKGYADFVILDAHKHPVEESFQRDDTFYPLPTAVSVLQRATGRSMQWKPMPN